MRFWHWSALALPLICYVFVNGPSHAASPIGSTVKASTTVSANGRTLRASSPIYLNDVLRSNATGVGQFIFDDGTKLAMGPSASLTIDQSIYKGASVKRASIQASRGAFRYISGKLSGKKIATPYGTIGIRGTAFDFTIRNGRLYLLLFRGEVNFCGGGGCKRLNRTCDFIVASGGGVTNPQHLGSARDSGVNINEAFPLLANQGRLTSQFRQAKSACLTRVVNRTRFTRTVKIESPPPASEPPPAPGPEPSPPSKGNKGFGNNGESDDTSPDAESQNPGRGNAYGRNK
jgi:hypothetical protein